MMMDLVLHVGSNTWIRNYVGEAREFFLGYVGPFWSNASCRDKRHQGRQGRFLIEKYYSNSMHLHVCIMNFKTN